MSILDSIPQLFWARLCAGRCLAFVGAGFSLPAGFPIWRTMVTRLVDEARSNGAPLRKPAQFSLAEDFLRVGDFALALDVLVREELIEKQERTRVLESLFATPRHLPVRMAKRLRNLTTTPWAGVLTTNYDRLIEEHMGPSGQYRKVESAGPVLGTLLSDPCRFFAKLHGESWKEHCVLTVEDYHRTYLREPFLEHFLHSAMLSFHFVFIGCSLEDELIRTRVRLCDTFNQQVPRSYALLPKSPESERRRSFLEKYAAIDCWLYDPADPLAPDHGAIDVFLDACCCCIDAGDSFPSSPTLQMKLAQIGRLNRMLLRAILACPNQEVELAVFSEPSDLQRRQIKDSWLASYFAHLSALDMTSRANRFVSLGLLAFKSSVLGDILTVTPSLEPTLHSFD
jgi:hypothetical protein